MSCPKIGLHKRWSKPSNPQTIIPYEPTLAGITINIHLILEYLAFFLAFRYYVFLRKRQEDAISSDNRLSIIIGAIFGALVGSRLVGFLENPVMIASLEQLLQLIGRQMCRRASTEEQRVQLWTPAHL